MSSPGGFVQPNFYAYFLLESSIESSSPEYKLRVLYKYVHHMYNSLSETNCFFKHMDKINTSTVHFVRVGLHKIS